MTIVELIVYCQKNKCFLLKQEEDIYSHFIKEFSTKVDTQQEASNFLKIFNEDIDKHYFFKIEENKYLLAIDNEFSILPSYCWKHHRDFINLQLSKSTKEIFTNNQFIKSIIGRSYCETC